MLGEDMGHIIKACCGCGYSEGEVWIGGGRANFDLVCMHPALCESGWHLVSLNIKEERMLCPEGHSGTPIPYYNSPSLQGEPGDYPVSQWNGHELSSGTYKCPRCGRFSLIFSGPELLFD